MKNLIVILIALFTTLTFAQQEKDLLGKWSFKNEHHMMKEQIPNSENVFTIELKEGGKLVSIDVYTQKGTELITVTEEGTWKAADGKITLTYSGKPVTTRNGKDLADKKVVKMYNGESSKKNTPAVKKLKDAGDKSRTINFFYKLDNGNLLMSNVKGDFKNSALFKKN